MQLFGDFSGVLELIGSFSLPIAFVSGSLSLAITAAFGAGGALLGIGATRSGEFKEGGGLVLLFLCAIAVCVAAVGGIIGALLPSVIGVWFVRIALFAFLFAVGAIASDRAR